MFDGAMIAARAMLMRAAQRYFLMAFRASTRRRSVMQRVCACNYLFFMILFFFFFFFFFLSFFFDILSSVLRHIDASLLKRRALPEGAMFEDHARSRRYALIRYYDEAVTDNGTGTPVRRFYRDGEAAAMRMHMRAARCCARRFDMMLLKRRSRTRCR